MLTVGVVSLDTKNSAALLAMLQQTGLVQPTAQWDLMAGEGPTSRAAVPDVVLVEIGRDPEVPSGICRPFEPAQSRLLVSLPARHIRTPAQTC